MSEYALECIFSDMNYVYAICISLASTSLFVGKAMEITFYDRYKIQPFYEISKN